jgi:hypothetical protein
MLGIISAIAKNPPPPPPPPDTLVQEQSRPVPRPPHELSRKHHILVTKKKWSKAPLNLWVPSFFELWPELIGTLPIYFL